MSILNAKKTEEHIVYWIKHYAETSGIKTLVVGLSGGVDSALVAILCKKTGLPTICINMPCHSSNYAYDRASKFADEFGLNLMTVSLDSAHDSIYEQIKSTNKSKTMASNNFLKKAPALTEDRLNNPVAVGGLRSCLRAPTLSFFALATNGVIVGTGNRSEDNLIRYFQKRGDGSVDISPISDLFKSEIYELFAYVTNLKLGWADKETGQKIAVGDSASAVIYNAKPTADLWGPEGDQEDEKELGLSYDEIEWADRENMRNNIITNNEDPVKHRSWPSYTLRQREVIAKVHQMEKVSRHKYNSNLPVCEVRKVEGLVR